MRILRRFMEVCRGDNLARQRPHPAQGFEAYNFTSIESDDWLIVGIDPLFGQGPTDLSNSPKSFREGGP
jgi:hypothetical protein